jgi:hypothetical protein
MHGFTICLLLTTLATFANSATPDSESGATFLGLEYGFAASIQSGRTLRQDEVYRNVTSRVDCAYPITLDNCLNQSLASLASQQDH